MTDENQPLLLEKQEQESSTDILIPHQPQVNHQTFIIEKTKGSRTASLPSAIFNTTNTIIGGGVLALPFAFANAGLVVGVVLVVLIGLLSWLTSSYLDRK